MTGRGRAPATPSDFFIFESFLCSFLPIQTWRGQDLNDGQGPAPHSILLILTS